MSGERKAVVLLSGGVDSSTVLAISRAEGYGPYALSFNYGQRHAVELEAAGRVARSIGVREHRVVELDMRNIGGSALTAEAVDVPKSPPDDDIPVTYVPARNTIFLSYALAWAEVLGAGDIFVGVNNVDYSGYPDCRPEYIKAFQEMANLATKASVEGSMSIRLHAPLMNLGKAEIIKRGRDLGLDYSLTWSCYDPPPGGSPCGRCHSCLIREKGFKEAGGGHGPPVSPL
jgi:7-cyano-7-deazaguanine synthase